jgi:tetratricopeptide (TPR) repeat protein
MEEKAKQTFLARAEQFIIWRRYKEALQELHGVLRMVPGDADAMALIARVHLLRGEHDKALHWAGTALQSDPDHRLAWLVRVCVFYRTGQDGEFREAVMSALRIDPEEPEYYFMIANVLDKRERLQEAKDYLHHALKLRPDHPVYLAMAGYLEAQDGNFAESVQYERQALACGMESPQALMLLSLAARVRGDSRRQEDFMREAVRLDPESETIREQYLAALQYSNRAFRFVFRPIAFLARLKPWKRFALCLFLLVILKHYVLLFIILYLLTNRITRAIVHVRVFGVSGWRRRA